MRSPTVPDEKGSDPFWIPGTGVEDFPGTRFSTTVADTPLGDSDVAVKVTVKETAPCRKELRVEVPLQQVKEVSDAVYRELKRVAAVPGFRVGFAPRDLLQRYHGERARREIVDQLLDSSIKEALQSQGPIDWVGRPEVSQVDFSPDKPLTYVAVVELAPEVPKIKATGLKLTPPQVEITEEAVEKTLTQLHEANRKLKAPEESRPTKEGDFLLVDLIEEPRGKPLKTRRDLLFSLDLKNDPKGFLKNLEGMAPGEKRITVLEDGTIVTVTLKGIKVKEASELNDAFARSVGPYETLAALKEAIRKELTLKAQANRRQALEAQAAQRLLESFHFEVPPSLVESQARRILRQKTLELMSQGVPPEKINEQASGLVERSKLDAVQHVMLFFILRQIAKEESLWVKEEELQERIQLIGQRLGRPEKEVQKELEEKDLLEDLRWSITREKVMDFILTNAQVEEA